VALPVIFYSWHQFLLESHNRAVYLYKEESRGAIQPAEVTCREITDPAMLVVAQAAGRNLLLPCALISEKYPHSEVGASAVFVLSHSLARSQK
jgi:hypothetical protein